MLSMFAKPERSLEDELFGRSVPTFEKRSMSGQSNRIAVADMRTRTGESRRSSGTSGTGAIERSIPSVGQYLYHLSHDLKSYTRAETLNAVIGAKPAEIQRVAKIAAKLKGRYLALIVDLGTAERGPIGEADMRELERARRMSEEAEAGLAALRAAIESGDLELEGVRAAE